MLTMGQRRSRTLPRRPSQDRCTSTSCQTAKATEVLMPVQKQFCIAQHRQNSTTVARDAARNKSLLVCLEGRLGRRLQKAAVTTAPEATAGAVLGAIERGGKRRHWWRRLAFAVCQTRYDTKPQHDRKCAAEQHTDYIMFTAMATTMVGWHSS